MADEKKVAQETISKALVALQELAKGHTSGATNTTRVESMRDSGAGAGSDAGSTQVHHTPSNSDPNGWAGSTASSVPEDGATDNIDANGTDYNGVSAGLMKSIFEKIEKGESLSEAEQYVLKSAFAKGKPPFVKDDDKDEEVDKAKDEDDKDDMGKSLHDAAQEDEDVNKGMNMAPFLSGWAKVQSDQLVLVEQRLSKSIKEVSTDNVEFQTDLAKSIASLAEVLAVQSQRIEQLESAPARGPKSQQTPEPVDKSFTPGSPAEGDQLSKSVVLDTMVDMVQKGQLAAQEVIRFESTNEIRPDLYKQIVAHHNGR